jgi:hypothetical protein
MKKLTLALLSLTMIAGVTAPAFAWNADNCPFSEASFCSVGSIAETE